MFENFTTALIQLIGFFGVFAFFVYQLFSDKKFRESNKTPVKTKTTTLKKEAKVGFFRRRQKKVQEEEPPLNRKRGWFKK